MRGGPRGFRPGFTCPAVLRYLTRKAVRFRLRGRYPLWREFPFTSTNAQLCNFPTRRQTDQVRPYNPCVTTTAVYHVTQVWALPFSLATTQGVEVSFLSSGYLDVSVPRLAFTRPILFRRGYSRITTSRFPHSEIPGSKVGQHLPRAYRSRPRPSSALSAKASTVCPYSLDRKELMCCRYGVFKVRAGRRPLSRKNQPRGRSLKTQQRTRYRGRRNSRRAGFSGRPKPSTGPTPTGVRAPVFPRKEVIQPQLPLRLPCYDFTPIINPTFDGSLPCGLGHRLRVLPTFVV